MKTKKQTLDGSLRYHIGFYHIIAETKSFTTKGVFEPTVGGGRYKNCKIYS